LKKIQNFRRWQSCNSASGWPQRIRKWEGNFLYLPWQVKNSRKGEAQIVLVTSWYHRTMIKLEYWMSHSYFQIYPWDNGWVGTFQTTVPSNQSRLWQCSHYHLSWLQWGQMVRHGATMPPSLHQSNSHFWIATSKLSGSFCFQLLICTWWIFKVSSESSKYESQPRREAILTTWLSYSQWQSNHPTTSLRPLTKLCVWFFTPQPYTSWKAKRDQSDIGRTWPLAALFCFTDQRLQACLETPMWSLYSV
jgi:hypothetical protein